MPRPPRPSPTPSRAPRGAKARGARSSAARDACAARIVELVPLWMREVRAQMRAAAPEGLSVPLFRALIFARSRPGASVSELAAHLGVTLPTASVTIDKLVAQDLMQSLDAPGSRRTRALHLTPAGQAAVARAWNHTTEVMSARLEGLGGADLDRILQALELLARRLVDDPQDKTTS